jgi:arabinogalactan endo-1,4-beta-galactosidase
MKKLMKRILFTCTTLLVSISVIAQESEPSTYQLNYAVGADLSFLKMAEDSGSVFKENGMAKPGLDIFRDHGYDWIRLRLFHTPDELPNDLEYTIELAKEAKSKGFKFLLDYHYADSWADPAKQPVPAAWQGLELEVLRDSVYEYTKRTIEAFREAGVMPEMVQIGNEIRVGMMWPIGKLPDGWDAFAELLKAGIEGVEAGQGQEMRPLIMIHYDNGADVEGNRYFYDKILAYNISFDIIGLSYYPWWHGNLLELRENLISLTEHYEHDIILVETAYNWRKSEYQEEELAPYPETPEGQKDFLISVNETLLNIPSRKIKGIFWWEPAVMENVVIRSRGIFDDEGNVLPVIDVFNKYKRD